MSHAEQSLVFLVNCSVIRLTALNSPLFTLANPAADSVGGFVSIVCRKKLTCKKKNTHRDSLSNVLLVTSVNVHPK